MALNKMCRSTVQCENNDFLIFYGVENVKDITSTPFILFARFYNRVAKKEEKNLKILKSGEAELRHFSMAHAA